jgi:hypothetical protein
MHAPGSLPCCRQQSGKRHEREARSSWLQAQKLGFRGNLSEWSRLLGRRAASLKLAGMVDPLANPAKKQLA